MELQTATILTDTGKPAAAPGHNGCVLPGAASTGEALTGPSPIPILTGDVPAYLAPEIVWPEIWPARHNDELWQTGSAGTFAWRNQADGVYSEAGRNPSAVKHAIELRSPRAEDLANIVALVRNCAPFLTAHVSYIYWAILRYCRETCVVAEQDGDIVGWWSILRVTSRKYFIHQMAVAPRLRRQGLGRSLARYLLDKLKAGHPAFELEFTVDRKNKASVDLVQAIADDAGMELVRQPERVTLLEDGCEEELYIMRPFETATPGTDTIVSNEAANALWTPTERTEATATSALSS